MKCLLIYPPQALPEAPPLATALLKSLLNNHGNETEQADFNVEFYDYILKPDRIKNTLDKIFEDYEKNSSEIFNNFDDNDDNKELEEYPEDFQNKYLKYKKTKELNKEEAYQHAEKVQDYIDIIKNKEKNYGKEEIMKARTEVWKILGYIFLPFSDSKIINERYFYFIRNYRRLNDFLDESKNIFYDFYETKIPEIIKKNPDYIGISIAAQSQMLPGLTLARLLKQKTNAHINIGGSYFSRIKESFKDKPEFFENFIDSIIYEEGEIPVLKLIEYLEGKIKIEEVPNLVYSKDKTVQINEKVKEMPLNDIPIPDFSGLPMDLYFSSEITAHLLAERGCYWSKCTFCDVCFTGNQYDFKNTAKVVSELSELKEKFGFSKFFFVCEAMSPAYLRKLSNEIINTGLKIKFILYARIEREFTEDLLKLAKKAGAIEIMWGVESVNKRILGLMNKTKFTDTKDRLTIIKTTHKLGIDNTCFFMLGFPGETRKEAEETIDFIQNNKKYIKNPLVAKFNLREHSLILENPDKFLLTEYGDKDEFDLYYYRHETSSGMNFNEIGDLYNNFFKELYCGGEIPLENLHELVYSATFWGY